MKYYRVEVEIREGNDEFWESLTVERKTGCDEILQTVEEGVSSVLNIEAGDVRLVEYSDYK